MGVFEPTRFMVYGNPNEEVRKALADFGAVYLGVFGGFAR